MIITISEVVTAEAVDAATDAIISHMGRVTRLLTNREHARYVASLAVLAAAAHIAAAERDRIISIASQLRATIPADHPPGAQASFADYLRVTSGDAT